MALREWWGAYLVSPLGTVAGVAVYTIVSVVGDPHLALGEIGAAFGYMALIAVAISYFVGVLLLPVYLMFEAFGWRGWKIYVPTGLVAGLLVTVQILIAGAGTSSPQAFVLCATCGALCAWVFSVRVAQGRR